MARETTGAAAGAGTERVRRGETERKGIKDERPQVERVDNRDAGNREDEPCFDPIATHGILSHRNWKVRQRPPLTRRLGL